MHSSGPVAGLLTQVRYGHGGERQTSACGGHIGEAQAQGSVPVRRRAHHLQVDLLPQPHWAAAEHQAVSKGRSLPRGQSAALTQSDLVSRDPTVESQGAEAGPSTAVGHRGLITCNVTNALEKTAAVSKS